MAMGICSSTSAGDALPSRHSYKTWRKKYVKPDPQSKGLLYVAYNEDGFSQPQEACTCSESIGWGMLASVLADERYDFEGLLAFYEKHLNSSGLMSWQLVLRGKRVFVDPEGTGHGSATDGDMDAAYALLLAGRRWGCQDYTQRGIRVCRSLHTWCIHPTMHMPLLGDWAGKAGSTCTGHPAAYVTRPSDFMLTHFKLFAEEDKERSTAWQLVGQACIKVLVNHVKHCPSGLVPDFMVFDPALGQYRPPVGKVLETERDGHFGWNACRSPWRLAASHVDSPDVAVLPILQAMAQFFAKQQAIVAGYSLQGKPLESFTSLAFLAPVIGLMQALGQSRPHLEQQIAAEQRYGSATYYGDTIAMLVSLQLQTFLERGSPLLSPKPVRMEK